MRSSYLLPIIWISCFARLTAESPNTNQFGYAQQIVYTTTDKKRNNKLIYHHHPHGLNVLLESSGPYKIISFIGEQRIGKSTTLNKIVSILEGHEIEPFSIGHELEPKTYGIWMYVVEKCDNYNHDPVCYDGIPCRNDRNCINSDYSYVFLDIEGSDSATDDVALRYASIVTLMSSKIFWMIKTTVSKHNMDMINRIEQFRKVMDSQNVAFNFDDIDLNIIIREPLGNQIGEALQMAINNLFKPYIGSELDSDAKLTKTIQKEHINVLKLDNIKNESYEDSVQQVVDLILDGKSYKKNAGKTVEFGVIDAKDTVKFLEGMINELNENPDLNAICIGCIFKDVVKWSEWSEWTNCSKKCDGGDTHRERTCNTGTIKDCTKYVGGNDREERKCNEIPCNQLNWDEWSQWTQCTKKCGGGIQQRWRECMTRNNKDCIDERGGTNKEERKCNVHSCNIICSVLGIFC